MLTHGLTTLVAEQRSTRTSSYHLRTSKLAPGAYAVAPADPSDDGTAGTDDGTDDSVSDISSTEGSVETEAEVSRMILC